MAAAALSLESRRLLLEIRLLLVPALGQAVASRGDLLGAFRRDVCLLRFDVALLEDVFVLLNNALWRTHADQGVVSGLDALRRQVLELFGTPSSTAGVGSGTATEWSLRPCF